MTLEGKKQLTQKKSKIQFLKTRIFFTSRPKRAQFKPANR